MILQPRLGLRAALEVKQQWRGRASCQQVEEAVLLGLGGVSWELSSIPCLLLLGSGEQEERQDSVKETPDFAVCFSSACKELSKVLNVCRFQWDFGKTKAGKP